MAHMKVVFESALVSKTINIDIELPKGNLYQYQRSPLSCRKCLFISLLKCKVFAVLGSCYVHWCNLFSLSLLCSRTSPLSKELFSKRAHTLILWGSSYSFLVEVFMQAHYVSARIQTSSPSYYIHLVWTRWMSLACCPHSSSKCIALGQRTHLRSHWTSASQRCPWFLC